MSASDERRCVVSCIDVHDELMHDGDFHVPQLRPKNGGERLQFCLFWQTRSMLRLSFLNTQVQNMALFA